VVFGNRKPSEDVRQSSLILQEAVYVYVHEHVNDHVNVDVDVIMERVRVAKLQTLSKTGGPVFIGPVTRSLFVTNPDGFRAEFMDHNLKKRP
jgi:hypothetical protein